MGFVVEDPAKHLKVNEFLGVSGLERFKSVLTQPFRTVSIVNSDIVRVASAAPLSVPIDILSSLKSSKLTYKYVYVLAVLISGRWHISSASPGSVLLVLYDRRLQGHRSCIYGGCMSKVSANKFQVKYSVGHSLTVNDFSRNPLSLCVALNGVPCDDGWEPLSIEVATLLMFTNYILEESLTSNILKVPPLSFDNNSVCLDQDIIMSKFNSVLSTVAVPRNVLKCTTNFEKKRLRKGKWVGNKSEFVLKGDTNVDPMRYNGGFLHQREAEHICVPDSVVGRTGKITQLLNPGATSHLSDAASSDTTC
ncbi:movement protein [Cactus mild mottle virus]|uniref:Movement protein n=1 Tax=Cactus mild mottle virus TaxID=229030 RepID=B8PRG8_9VIRU|nr:33 kDa [Cactus mild mottle virus]ABX57122.1 movement protein [Cactus mild mottle virus]